MPPKPSAASRCSSQTVTARPCSAARARACSASHSGFFRFEGTVASRRARQPAPPAATARDRVVATAPGSGRPASTMRRTGWCSGGVERQWNAKEPSIAPTTNASRPVSGDSAGIVVATEARSRAARARAAPARRKSCGRCSPTPTSSTQRRASFSGPPSGTGNVRHLTRTAGRPGQLEQGQEVDAELVGHLGRPGPEQGRAPVVPLPGPGAGQHGQREHLHAGEGVGTVLAEREVRRRDLGGEGEWADRARSHQSTISRRRP